VEGLIDVVNECHGLSIKPVKMETKDGTKAIRTFQPHSR